jgi:hypothetical protein
MPALSLTLILGASSPVPAQERPQADRGDAAVAQSSPKSAPPGASSNALTGKERLGGKWMDEQRIDNCKVPPEQRGAKPRPDACAGGAAN